MILAANTSDTAKTAASAVKADVQDQVTQSVTALDQIKEFLLNHGPDVLYAIIIFIIAVLDWYIIGIKDQKNNRSYSKSERN